VLSRLVGISAEGKTTRHPLEQGFTFLAATTAPVSDSFERNRQAG